MTWWHRHAGAVYVLCVALTIRPGLALDRAVMAPSTGTVPLREAADLRTMFTNEWADLAGVWERKPPADASPVENLTLPIEHYEDGRIRAVLHAGKAALGREGQVWAWQVLVETFDPHGLTDGRVEAETCLYDRNSRRGYCRDHVRLVRSDAMVNGTGLYWTMAEQRMQILSKPVVELQRAMRAPAKGIK